ncbi:4202_t:CDS:2, partial [Ambispora leptoticha]
RKENDLFKDGMVLKYILNFGYVYSPTATFTPLLLRDYNKFERLRLHRYSYVCLAMETFTLPFLKHFLVNVQVAFVTGSNGYVYVPTIAFYVP